MTGGKRLNHRPRIGDKLRPLVLVRGLVLALVFGLGLGLGLEGAGWLDAIIFHKMQAIRSASSAPALPHSLVDRDDEDEHERERDRLSPIRGR